MPTSCSLLEDICHTSFIKFDYQSNETQVNFMVRTKPSADIAALFSAMHDTAPVLAVTLTNETNV